MNLLGEIKTVLWSFVGIGGRKRPPGGRGSPWITIAVAFVLVALLLGTLAGLARYAAAAA